MNPDIIKERIRIEQHKFEIVYLKNLWTVILALGGFVVVLLQLFLGQNLSADKQKLIFVILVIVIAALTISLIWYTIGRRRYIKTINNLFDYFKQYAQKIEEK